MAADSLTGNVTGTYTNYSPMFPNPVTCFVEIVLSLKMILSQNLIPWNGVGPWLVETWEWHYICTYISWSDVLNVIFIGLFFTLLRFIMYKTLLERIPKWYGLNKSDAEKFPEAAFRTIMYLLLWILTCWSLAKRPYFFEPISIWEGWRPGLPVPSDIYLGYVLQMGFYVHMIYATTYVETVRKDYAVQMIHHFLTLALLSYSLSLRLHNIGLFVLFIHDIADVFLELAKCFIYFKTMHNLSYSTPETLANITFAFFTLQWILFRLYWFPVKLLYATGRASHDYYSSAPFYSPFNIMLIVLYALHVYWFYFIMMLVVKVVAGEEIADNRDMEEEEKKTN